MTFEEAIQRLAPCTKAFETEAFDLAGMELSYHYECAEDCCESEIEKVFYMAYALNLYRARIFGTYQSDYLILAPNVNRPLECIPDPDVYFYTLFKPQYRVLDYRVDFAIRKFMKLPEWGAPIMTPIVIVECDGHDFHEKTKDQAARDKERDRLLHLEGHVVMRFTGSELWRDPEECVKQIDELLNAKLREQVDAMKRFATTKG